MTIDGEISTTTTAPKAPTPGRSAHRRASTGGSRIPMSSQIAAMTLLLICTIYFVIPVYWVVVSSTKNSGDLFGSFGLWFAHPQWFTNLSSVFSYDHGIFVRWLVNSVIYAGVGSIVATLLAAAAGYALSKYQFRGREFLFSVVLAGVMVPSTVIALPLFLLVSKVGLNNTYWSVLLPSMLSPFGVYLSRIYAASAVPEEIIDAARTDGANEFRIFSTIALRMMTPALVTVFLFHLVAVWNNYFLPLVMLSNQRLYPVVLGLAQWNGQTQLTPSFYPLIVTGAFVSVVILVGVIISLQRFWRGGLAAGSIR